MAKKEKVTGKEKDDDEDLLSEETLDCLGDVRRGKPRRFVLISQGDKVKSLVVYKKGALDARLREAKESGRGTVSHGIVDGQGANLTFKLAIADGFKEAPVRETALKLFLSDAAEMSTKPTFEIVQALPPLPDDKPPGSPPTTPAPTGQTQPEDPLAEEFKSRLTALKTRLADLRVSPDEAVQQLAEQAAALGKQAGALAQQDEYSRALELLTQAEKLANSAAQIPAKKPAANPRQIWIAAKDQIDDQVRKLQEALRSFSEPRLARIAEMGLHGITERRQAQLLLAIAEFEQAMPSDRLGPPRDKLLKAIDSLAEFIATDPIVTLCDKNPFGAPVSIRTTLGKAFAEMQKSVG